MLVQFVIDNPSEALYIDLPQRNMEPNPRSPEFTAIPIGIAFFDESQKSVWFVASLEQCPPIGAKVYAPGDVHSIFTVNEVYVDASVGKSNGIFYQCFCSTHDRQACCTCTHWEQDAEDGTGTCLITVVNPIPEPIKRTGRAWVDLWDKEGEQIDIDAEDQVYACLTTQPYFACSRWIGEA